MVKSSTGVARYKMTFPSDILGEPFMYKLSHDMSVRPNILRGRISEKGAWLEVEIEGAQKCIDKAVKFLKDKGVAVKQL